MDRKTAPYPLKDGKTYVFAERNREDINYTLLQNKYRAARIKEIKTIISDPADIELRDGLIFNEFSKAYVSDEVFRYIEDDPEMKLELVYASFKIKNPGIALDDFKKLVDDVIIQKLLKAINELEQEEPALDDEVIKELKIKKELFLSWKKDHPEIYWLIKKELKKKADRRSVKK